MFSHQWWNKNVCILKTRYGFYHRELSFNHLYGDLEWKDAVTLTERIWGVRGWGGNSTWQNIGSIICVRGWQTDMPQLWALLTTPEIPPGASIGMSSMAETVESQASQGRPFQCISPINPSPSPSQRIQRKPSKWERGARTGKKGNRNHPSPPFSFRVVARSEMRWMRWEIKA